MSHRVAELFASFAAQLIPEPQLAGTAAAVTDPPT